MEWRARSDGRRTRHAGEPRADCARSAPSPPPAQPPRTGLGDGRQLSLPLNKPTPTQCAPDLAVETVDTPIEPKGIATSGPSTGSAASEARRSRASTSLASSPKPYGTSSPRTNPLPRQAPLSPWSRDDPYRIGPPEQPLTGPCPSPRSEEHT